MLNIFKYKKLEKYRETLMSAFPASLKNDVFQVLSILPLNDNNIMLSNGQAYKVDELIHSDFQVVALNNENLKIPCRIYFNEPKKNKENRLSEIQNVILNCIFLCHHNGYIRQKRLENLAMASNEFIVPFAFKLLGEYVIEILEVLDPQINETTISNYSKFIHFNPKYWIQTQSRVVSYWNAYYRYPRHKYLRDYIGNKIIFKINCFYKQNEKPIITNQ